MSPYMKGRKIWEPFCGGLWVSAELYALQGPLIISDAHAPLINLWKAVSNGWAPPEIITENDYKAAKLLPDEDPLKAFCGFGMSFGGKWFGGYARSNQDYLRLSTNNIERRRKFLGNCYISCIDFLTVEPFECPDLFIYCDPPYEGTTGYAGTPTFDHDLFLARCLQWRMLGAEVFISEYNCRIPHEIVWERQPKKTTLGARDRQAKRANFNNSFERLFRVIV